MERKLDTLQERKANKESSTCLMLRLEASFIVSAFTLHERQNRPSRLQMEVKTSQECPQFPDPRPACVGRPVLHRMKTIFGMSPYRGVDGILLQVRLTDPSGRVQQTGPSCRPMK